MQYIHNPPSLSELRQIRKEAKTLVNTERPVSAAAKKGFFARLFGKDESIIENDSLNVTEELINHQLDVIVAHLENQNELLLELTRKIDKSSHD